MSSARRLLIREAKEALMNQTRTITSPNAYSTFLPLRSAIVRPAPSPRRSIVTMNKDDDPNQLEAIVQQKQALRSKMRKALKSMDPIQRSQEDNAIQNFVLEAPWFKSSKKLCAYVSCAALREVDTSKILSEILCNAAEVMQASEPVDLFVLPGLAFDRGEDVWDVVVVALSYSLQIVDEGAIAITHNDVPVDAIVSPAGFIPTSPAATKMSD